MQDIENVQYDASYYDSWSYKHKMYNGDSLYQAFIKSRKGSAFKSSVKKFRLHRLTNIARLRQKLLLHEYQFHDMSNNIINERGKIRLVCGEVIEDRIVEHIICDEILNPTMFKYLIYDNGASQPNKGTDFARRRLEHHLHKYYRQYKTNDGWILLIDFSKYYDNIWHETIRNMFSDKLFLNPCYDDVMLLINNILDRSKIDVSWLSNEDIYDLYYDTLDYLKFYLETDTTYQTGIKFLNKHICLGNQVGQTAGVSYRIPIDNYIKIVKGEKFYGAYNDDAYIISESKEHLEELFDDILLITKSVGITVNLKKTKIVKLSSRWRYLQIQYCLTDTGKVLHKINPKRLYSMRRKLRKLIYKMTEKEFLDYYKSWFNSYKRYLSRRQRQNLDSLLIELLNIKKKEVTYSMAIAKKCDACKEFYDFNNDEQEANGVVLVFFNAQGQQSHTIDRAELCPDCLKKVRDIIKP